MVTVFDDGEYFLVATIGRTEVNDPKIVQWRYNDRPENIGNAEHVRQIDPEQVL